MSKMKQAFAWWANANRGVEDQDLIKAAVKIGYQGIDFIDEKLWQSVKDHGLSISAISGHGTIESGLNDARNASRIEDELKTNIEKAAKWKIPSLVCFSGNRTAEINDETGLVNCAKTLAKVAPLAEQAGVTLIVELLNSKVDHKDYQCDHTAWGVKLCQKVNSPAVKLLYDIYHMQIMEGDLIRTIQKNHSYFAYYHTAGNPGRNQPDETQEIYYPAIYRTIVATGYAGYVSHEFVPIEGASVVDGLEKAFRELEESIK